MIIPRMINKAVSIAFAGCLLLLISCTEDSFVENSARLRISLTESSSIPLSEANLQITSIEVKLTDSTGQSQDEWIPLEYAGGTYNLLKYLKGETIRIADQYFSAGTITQIRIKLASTLHIVDKYSLLSDQQQLPVDLATEYQDGVVVAADIPLTPNVITDILLDFNLAQSNLQKQRGRFCFCSLRQSLHPTGWRNVEGHDFAGGSCSYGANRIFDRYPQHVCCIRWFVLFSGTSRRIVGNSCHPAQHPLFRHHSDGYRFQSIDYNRVSKSDRAEKNRIRQIKNRSDTFEPLSCQKNDCLILSADIH